MKKVTTKAPARLDKDMVVGGMACLGRHPLHHRHTYLECNLSNLNLADISLLNEYPNFMYLNISNNHITALDVLDAMPMLVQLNASHNKLNQCLDFVPPRCSSETAWSTGHNAVGSMLTLADLSHNEIVELRTLDDHPFLECLLLGANSISVIQGLQNLRFLRILDLSFNNITEITGLDGLIIQELSLRGNKLTKLDGLQNLPCLTTLDVAYNNITSLAALNQSDQLNYLDCSDNKLARISELDNISHLQWLRKLVVVNNPCCDKKYYRSRVIYRLPQIVHLDSTNVAAEDKIAAMNLYGSQAGDKVMRREMFAKYFPDEPFVDFSEHVDGSDD